MNLVKAFPKRSLSYRGWSSRVRDKYVAEFPLDLQLQISVSKQKGMPICARLQSWYERLPEARRDEAIPVLKAWIARNREAL